MIAQLWARGSMALGEGPRWLRPRESEAARLRWSDLLDGAVFESDDVGGSRLVERFPGETVSAQIPLTAGGTAIVLRRTVVLRDRDGTERQRLSPELPDGLRFSDGTAGPSGHLWIGIVPDGDSRGHSALLRIGRDGVREMRSGLGFANGIGFTADGDRLLHVDSEAGTVVSIVHDARTGELGESRTLFLLADLPGSLDGLAVDDLDRVWVAVFGEGVVLCIDRDGTILDRVAVPAERVSSCCFGPDALYITTARVDASELELQRSPLSGSVFRCEVGRGGGPIWEGDLLT